MVGCGKEVLKSYIMKMGRNIARNIDFEVAEFEVHAGTRRKTSNLELQRVKIGSFLRNGRFEFSSCFVLLLLVLFWRRRAYAGNGKTSHVRRFQKRLLRRFVCKVSLFVTFLRVCYSVSKVVSAWQTLFWTMNGSCRGSCSTLDV